MRRKCERPRGNINADAANAEVFAGDECSQGASFGPIAAISRRWRGGRIYNNTRTRERLRRKCVKPADLTTHSPPKICSRPRTATRTARVFSHSLPAHFRSPTQRRRTPADLTTHSPPKTFALPEHFLTPFPHTSTPPRSPNAHPHAAQMHARRPHNPFPAEGRRPPRTATRPSPSVPLRAQKNGTAQWMCDAECLGRPSLRSVIGVGEPRAVRRRCGALACRRGA